VSEIRKIAAILVADVVGYSRLAGADEDRTLSRLRGLRSDLIDPAIAANHGLIVKRTGDGSIIEFRSVVDAVRCAIEVQHGMIERNAGVPPERRIEFRIGIHLGDVVEEADGDLMGDGVNIAARLESIAKPSAICLSEQAYWQVKGRLDLAVTDLGPTQLKNIAEPIRVYSLEISQPVEAKLSTAAKAAELARPKAPWRFALLGVAIAALLVAIAAGSSYFVGANRITPVAANAPPPLAAQRFSIVVLPFANLSGDPTQDYLADALTDELTTDLARLPDTFVIARNTAFTYKGKAVDAKAIGKDLGVRYVLEGSVQPSGDRVRVNAQLIDAGSGAHLWADQFDAARAGLLDTQDEIVARLARALDIQLTEVEAARLKRTPSANPTAEDLALRCVASVLVGRYAGNEAEAGYGLCEQALALDPNNVRALTYSSVKFQDSMADIERADVRVSKALALDPNYADAHVAKAWILWRQRRLEEAIVEDERALALNPALLDAYVNMGLVYRTLGRFEESLGFFDRAIRRSPNDPEGSASYAIKAGDHIALKQYDQALESARRAIAISPNFTLAHWYLITALVQTGQDSQAHEALRRYLALPGVPATVAALKQETAKYVNQRDDPRYVEKWDQLVESMRKGGLPEK
jgi:adenylate cyclase